MRPLPGLDAISVLACGLALGMTGGSFCCCMCYERRLLAEAPRQSACCEVQWGASQLAA